MNRSLLKLLGIGALTLTGIAQAGAASFITVTADDLQYFRPNNKDGINVFETFALRGPEFNGLSIKVGGHFTQQFQALNHQSSAIPAAGNTTALIEIGNGFNLATANLTLDAQLADGVRMNLITYLSSRHHTETWVKGGYVQIDRSPFQIDWLEAIMEKVSVRIGHMEINYGDMHFRRSDNANSLYNPFVGNLIMDAFTTEIGAEVYGYHGDFFGMIGMSGGEIQGGLTRARDRSPSYYGKLGFDRQMTDDLRVRLTGSAYTTSSSINNTLYSGDRAGSRYYLVMEAPGASPSANFTSGRFNPGLNDEVTAFVFNPFVKFRGLEFFGNIETASGRSAAETSNRRWNQYSGEIVYRFLEDEKVYTGVRWTRATGELRTQVEDATIDRLQIGAGWFINRYMLLKAEYVIQDYKNFMDPTDTRHNGRFDGFVIEAAIGF